VKPAVNLPEARNRLARSEGQTETKAKKEEMMRMEIWERFGANKRKAQTVTAAFLGFLILVSVAVVAAQWLQTVNQSIVLSEGTSGQTPITLTSLTADGTVYVFDLKGGVPELVVKLNSVMTVTGTITWAAAYDTRILEVWEGSTQVATSSGGTITLVSVAIGTHNYDFLFRLSSTVTVPTPATISISWNLA